MKIYNFKGLATGLGLIAMGVVLTVLAVIKPQPGAANLIQNIVLIGLSLVLGGAAVARSLSKSATHNQRLAERDERQVLIRLRANTLTLEIVVGVAAVVALGLAVIDRGHDDLIMGIITGSLLTLGVAFWAWVGATAHFNRKF
ncbi:hypothetical protein [Lacticaseibacillus parakribbianus]|uniref:hypothetical protein n=1 Tax=Lacticaseibacillus parakribbianus TaxID=2970927 RepID=UPI0021CB19BD|nr:hypothetical protein [Lacticaseibacillus parakribbianus]